MAPSPCHNPHNMTTVSFHVVILRTVFPWEWCEGLALMVDKKEQTQSVESKEERGKPQKKAVAPEPRSVSHPIIHIGVVRLNAAIGPRLLPRPKDKYETIRGQEKEAPPKEGITHNPQRHRMRHRHTSNDYVSVFYNQSRKKSSPKCETTPGKAHGALCGASRALKYRARGACVGRSMFGAPGRNRTHLPPRQSWVCGRLIPL